jgi:hypothetical protein
MEPITEIFENELKPRLDKLPTRAQRAAAQQREERARSKAENARAASRQSGGV